MAQVSGVVESKSRKGTGVKINGAWYNAKSASMLANVEWKSNATIEVDADGKTIVSVVDAGNASPSTSNSTSRGSSYVDNQPVIAFQAARNTAMSLMTAAIEAGAVTLPNAKGDKLKAMEAFLDEYTERFYNQAMAVRNGDPVDVVLFGENSE